MPFSACTKAKRYGWLAVLVLAVATPLVLADQREILVDLNGQASIKLLESAENDFLGIGAIEIEDIPLSSSARPMQIEVIGRGDKYDVWHKPQPFKYRSQKFTRIDKSPTTATVVVELGHEDGTADCLEIIFELVRENFYESSVSGIKHHFTWSSEHRYAHQVRETSWWTFGESVEGLRCISQNSGYGRNSVDFVIEKEMPVGGYKLAGVVETSDIGRIIQQSTQNPVTFAYLPQKEARETRQGDGDYLTFLCREEQNLSFLRYADVPTMNYWEFERVAGEKEIRFEEWYCTPLTQRLATAPIITAVLHKAGVNAWIDAKEIVREKLLQAAGLPDLDPWPWVAYSQRAIDDPASAKDFVPYDQAFEMMKRAGIKEFWWYGPWQSNWSEIDRMSPAEKKKHPIYGHSVWDYDWAYKKFDVEGIKNLVLRCREAGIYLTIWATQTMSQCSPHIYAHPEWALRGPDGSLFNYVYEDLVGVNHHSGWSDFYVNRMMLRRQEIPFDSIWMDSFFFSGDIIDWRDVDLYPNFIAALDTMKKLHAQGFRRIYTEHHGPFAISSATGYMDKTKKKAGERLYLLHNLSVCDHLGNENLEYSAENYFQQLAFKSCPQPYLRHYINNPDFVPLASYANGAYTKALPYMKKCVVLDDHQGTLYWSADRQKAVVFSFTTGSIEVGKTISSATEILSETPCAIEDSRLTVTPYKVYLLEVK